MMIERYFLWFVFYSIVGWVYETILCSSREGRFINRGFLNGPYCPIYGAGAVLDLLILGRIENPICLFFSGVVVTCTLEYLTSYAMERLFNARWWDYSHMRFNIKGRVCLLGAIVFGLFSVILIKGVHPVVVWHTEYVPPIVLHIVCTAVFALLSIDIVVTLTGMADFENKVKEISALIKQHNERITDKLHNTEVAQALNNAHESITRLLNGQQKRMLKSFPSLRLKNYDKITNEIRNYILKKHKK